jgi:hypothetical protein
MEALLRNNCVGFGPAGFFGQRKAPVTGEVRVLVGRHRSIHPHPFLVERQGTGV